MWTLLHILVKVSLESVQIVSQVPRRLIGLRSIRVFELNAHEIVLGRVCGVKVNLEGLNLITFEVGQEGRVAWVITYLLDSRLRGDCVAQSSGSLEYFLAQTELK